MSAIQKIQIHVQSSSNKITNPRWKYVQKCDSPPTAPIRPDVHSTSESISERSEYFRKGFDEAMMECIVEQSNLYAVQTNRSKPLMLKCKELEFFLLFYWKSPCVLCLVRDFIGQRTWASNMWVLWWPGSVLNTTKYLACPSIITAKWLHARKKILPSCSK